MNAQIKLGAAEVLTLMHDFSDTLWSIFFTVSFHPFGAHLRGVTDNLHDRIAFPYFFFKFSTGLLQLFC